MEKDKQAKLCPEQFAELVKQIRRSRDLNSEEHTRIFKTAKDSAELAEKIDQLLNKWTTFWGVVAGIRSVLLTVGFLYILARLIVDWGDAVKSVGM